MQKTTGCSAHQGSRGQHPRVPGSRSGQKEDDEDYNSIEVRIPDALKLPTYLNRVDDCLEKNARKALTQELGFGALEEGLSNLMVAIMKRARKNEEFKRTSYIAPYELADIAREVILEKFK